MKDLTNEITAHALKNALEFGKADAGRILPKLFQHGLEKKEIKNILPKINEIVKKINSLSDEKKKEMFSEYVILIPEKIEKEKGLPEIDVAGLKKVVTRLAPEPSKYNHIGHAISFLLNYLYAKKYNGKCLLRFEDTNPEKVSKEYVDAMKEDVLDYLDIKVDGTRYVSDDMDVFYGYAEKLIKQGEAFVCFCERENMQEFRHKGTECEHRQFPPKVQMERWKEFLKGKFKEGEATLRLKGNMQSQNHVMRDPVIFRTVNAKHYRHGTKYKIWPMYDFYNPIEDSLMGVTLILRSNEFDMRVELHDHLRELLGLKKQKIIQYGRFNVADFTTKGREIRELIESGKYFGWDDPRLITLRALRRRGITKEALYELTNQIGLSKHPVNLEFDMIASINRKLIDAFVNRFSFVENPVELKIEKAPTIKEISVPVHPDKQETRKIEVGRIFISSQDFEKFKGQEIRLLHLYNIKLDKKRDENSARAVFTSSENKNIQKINWVSDGVAAQILMPDGTKAVGLAESATKTLKKGEVLQFERFGFAKLDKIDKRGKTYEFWFTHK